jgi:hypothetical protein
VACHLYRPVSLNACEQIPIPTLQYRVNHPSLT